MALDLSAPPAVRPGSEPAAHWERLSRATADLDPPLAVLDLPSLAWNAHDLLARADGLPIRVASKSIRVRRVIGALLDLPGYAGVLAYTLPEAIWLATGDERHPPIGDVVVGYPSADRGALRDLAASEDIAARVTVMIDDVAQLDLIDAAVPPGKRPEIRVCLELDASYRHRVLGHVGVRRSPLHEPADLLALARVVQSRAGFRLVGMMAYEAQIAGVGNKGPGKGRVMRGLQAASAEELRERRGRAVAGVREIADLEFVNGGGTGSIESTHADPSVTEVAAGSGVFGPHLFDGYQHFAPAPAASFCLSVVRRPTPQIATLLGGGWIASGPPAADRLPEIAWPPGLRMVGREGAGEVQTPVRGQAAETLRVGDRVWLRHTKAGELSEHVDTFTVVGDGGGGSGVVDEVLGPVPSYRGEGKVFL